MKRSTAISETTIHRRSQSSEMQPTRGEFAQTVLSAMRDRGWSLRDVARELKVAGHRGSYEHIRKAASGGLIFSRKFSDGLCEVLGLDAAAMWDIAKWEKLRIKAEAAGIDPTSVASRPKSLLSTHPTTGGVVSDRDAFDDRMIAHWLIRNHPGVIEWLRRDGAL